MSMEELEKDKWSLCIISEFLFLLKSVYFYSLGLALLEQNLDLSHNEITVADFFFST